MFLLLTTKTLSFLDMNIIRKKVKERKTLKYASAPPSYNGRSRLIISNARKRDDGTYMCVAVNPAGEARALAAVRVKGQSGLTFMHRGLSNYLRMIMWYRILQFNFQLYFCRSQCEKMNQAKDPDPIHIL